MLIIELLNGVEFKAQSLEQAKEKYINYHIAKGIDARKIKCVYNDDDDSDLDDKDEFSKGDINDLFIELEEELQEFQNKNEEESEGLILAQQEGYCLGGHL